MSLWIYYGGIFDLVYFGYLVIVCVVCDELQVVVCMLLVVDLLYCVVFGVIVEQCCMMLLLVIGDELGLLLDCCELDCVSCCFGCLLYIVDILCELCGELGLSWLLVWLVGVDSLLGLFGWYEWEVLFDLVYFVVVEWLGSLLQVLIDGELGCVL